MKDFTLTIPWMYFTGIQNGDITVLFFEKLPLKDVKKGDLIKLHNTKDIKMYFDYAKIIPFRDVTDDIAKKAGFVNRELLSHHLMERFNISSYTFGVKSRIDDELFYMLVLTDDPTYSDGEVDVNMDVIPGSMIKASNYTAKIPFNNLTFNKNS